MKATQINYILQEKGFNTDEWTTLYSNSKNDIGIIGLVSDKNIFTNQLNTQFYFNTDTSLLYIRHLKGKGSTIQIDDKTVPVVVNGETLYFAPQKGQYNDPEIGYWAECLTFDSIVAFYDKRHSTYNLY